MVNCNTSSVLLQVIDVKAKEARAAPKKLYDLPVLAMEDILDNFPHPWEQVCRLSAVSKVFLYMMELLGPTYFREVVFDKLPRDRDVLLRLACDAPDHYTEMVKVFRLSPHGPSNSISLYADKELLYVPLARFRNLLDLDLSAIEIYPEMWQLEAVDNMIYPERLSVTFYQPRIGSLRGRECWTTIRNRLLSFRFRVTNYLRKSAGPVLQALCPPKGRLNSFEIDNMNYRARELFPLAHIRPNVRVDEFTVSLMEAECFWQLTKLVIPLPQ